MWINNLTVAGTFNNSGDLTLSGAGSINNLVFDKSGSALQVGSYSTLNLTNGITDIPAKTNLLIFGTISSGSSNGLANLSSIEGDLQLQNGKALMINTNTLTVVGGGIELYGNSSLSVTNLTVSGSLYDIVIGSPDGGFDPTPSVLTVNGTFTNGSRVFVGSFGPGDANVGILNNTGTIQIETAGVLTLTSSATSNNSGSISVAKGGEFLIGASNAAVTGKGSLVLGGGLVTGLSASDVLTNRSDIIGFGTIGNNSMGLINDGLITAAGNGDVLTIDPSSAGLNNQGRFNVNAGATMDITGPANSFLNFDAASGTLTGGYYNIVNGTLQFDNANIVTNAAHITLNGTQSRIIDQNGANGLANFASNATTGSFTLSGGRNFATSGAFSNAGSVTISKGSSFTVGGTANYTQTAGTTTVIGTLSLSSPGSVNVSGGLVLDTGAINTGSFVQTAGTTTVNGTLSAVSGGVNASGGSIYGIGTITGNINLTGGLLSAGSASKKAGELTLKATYAQSGAGALDVDLGGTTAGTQYDVLDITGTASLGGTLNVDLISGFKPTVGETFDIIDYSSETGAFATLNLPKLTGGDTWSITYNATDVVLTVDGPAAKNGTANGTAVKAASRALTGYSGTSAASGREPVAILSRATCFAERLIGAASCDKTVAIISSRGSETRADTGVSAGEVHNNIMVATRSISSERGGASHGTSTSATTMARFYLCTYLPSGTAHTIGCN